MKRVILSLAASFDGFIEGPNSEIDWLTFDEETGEVLNKFLQEIDTVLYGRVSYEAWGNYSPPDDSAEFEKIFYTRLNRMAKYVFSSTREHFPGQPKVVKSGISEFMSSLRQQPGKNIWLYGGSGLISTFLNLDLVDEFRIAVAPIILGKGTPLFKEVNHRIKLDLVHVRAGKSGVVEFKYERAFGITESSWPVITTAC
jgi:dihydrofolate reductase